MENSIQLSTVITCPECEFKKEETMANQCLKTWQCPNCGKWLRPKEEDGYCCVYCTYGSVRCPMHQKEGSCCGY